MSSKTSNTKRQSWLKRIVKSLLVMLAVTGLILLYVWWQWTSEPGYWKDNQSFLASTDSAQLDRMAEDIEKRVPMDVSQINAGDTQTIRLTFDEINAWLARRLEGWLVYQNWQFPAYVHDPMVAPDGDRLVAAVRLTSEGTDQVISAVVDIDVMEDGRCRLRFVKARTGRLSLPVGPIIDQLDLGSYSDEVEYISGSEPALLFEPLFPVDQARNARLVGIEVDDEGVSLTIRNERQ